MGPREVPHFEVAARYLVRTFRCEAGALRSCSACAPHAHASAGAQKRRNLCMHARKASPSQHQEQALVSLACAAVAPCVAATVRVAYSPTWLMSVHGICTIRRTSRRIFLQNCCSKGTLQLARHAWCSLHDATHMHAALLSRRQGGELRPSRGTSFDPQRGRSEVPTRYLVRSSLRSASTLL